MATTPNYRVGEVRINALKGVLMPDGKAFIDGVIGYADTKNHSEVMIASEEVREKVSKLIEECPGGIELLKLVKITVTSAVRLL